MAKDKEIGSGAFSAAYHEQRANSGQISEATRAQELTKAAAGEARSEAMLNEARSLNSNLFTRQMEGTENFNRLTGKFAGLVIGGALDIGAEIKESFRPAPSPSKPAEPRKK